MKCPKFHFERRKRDPVDEWGEPIHSTKPPLQVRSRPIPVCHRVLFAGGDKCTLDRILLGWCFHDPTLTWPYERRDISDEKGQAYMETDPMLGPNMWSDEPRTLQFLNESCGLVLVFCIEQRETFDELVKHADTVLQYRKEHNLSIALVGSEPGFCKNSTGTQQVTKEEAEMFARVLGTRYFEIHPKEGDDLEVHPFYQYIVKAIRGAF